MTVISYQSGPQHKFGSSPADIVIFGGAAGGGKSAAILIEALRHYHNPTFRTIMFRRTTKQLRSPGGLWDTSKQFYIPTGGIPRETVLDWLFPSGMKVQFSHLEHEKNIYDHQGAQFNYLALDELTHFTMKMFFYLTSRIRSADGNAGYARATCNPDSNSWVRKFIDWWIDNDTGYPIPERDGELRYFIRDGDKFIWGDTPQELTAKYGPEYDPTSVTFIKSTLEDNQILMSNDPKYKSRLMQLSRVDRAQLLEGNWNISHSKGELFKAHWISVLDYRPSLSDMNIVVRAWDRAATPADPDNPEKDPDYSVGVLMGVDRNGYFYILDVVRDRLSPFGVEQMTLNTAKRDGPNVVVKIFQDPGSAGVYEAQSYAKLLSGFSISIDKIQKDKITCAKPFSAACEHGLVRMVKAQWNDDLINELEAFPDGKHDDIVDACSSAFAYLTHNNVDRFVIEEDDYQQTNKLVW